MFNRIAAAQGKAVFDVGLYLHFSAQLLNAFRKGWAHEKLIGIDYGLDNEICQTMMELNLFRFSAAKTLVEVQQLNTIFKHSKSFAQFVEEGGKVTRLFNKQWAETEYNTAYLTAESSATYYRLKEQEKLFPYWEYKTVGDAKVRDEHAALDGLILPANDVRWKKIYPPNDWNCRCYVVPRTRAEVEGLDLKQMRKRADDYFETPIYEKAKAQGWGINRAITKEVFNENQMYIRKFPGKAAKSLNGLKAADYGLGSITKVQKAAKVSLEPYKGSATDWLNAAEKVDGDIVLQDYNKRQITLTAQNFKVHTTGSKQERVQYLNAMADVLKNPDEVWLQGDKLQDVYLIGHYKNESIVVWCKVEDGKMNRVNSWFKLWPKKSILDKYRGGLLIKTNPD